MKNVKSRTYRRVYRKTPGGNTVLQLKKRKPKKAHCHICKTDLKGVIRERPYRMRNVPRTQKRPERPYGGVLCSKCSRRLIIDKSRLELQN